MTILMDGCYLHFFLMKCEIIELFNWLVSVGCDCLFVPLCPPQLSDSGLYTCVATSSSGETSWSAFLDVRGTVTS